MCIRDSLSSVSKSSVVSIAVSVKDISENSSSKVPADLDISKLDDSFTGGTVSVKKTSQDGQPLSYEILVSNTRYKLSLIHI